MDAETLLQTPLAGLHRELGARMVPFAGWEMPVQFEGVLAEHRAVRSGAGLFDVSHMGQVLIEGAAAAGALERLVPQSVIGLAEWRQRYGFFTNENGGLRDDLMISSQAGRLYLVVNAACAEADLAHMRDHLPEVEIEALSDRALLAIQGPRAAALLAPLVPEAAAVRFMDHRILPGPFGEIWVSRSGYTGEDGFEISVASDRAEELARALLSAGAAPVGLGARDSLRLEAGLCLYGSDIDADTSPVEAGLGWAIQKVRRAGGARASGFPGAGRILSEMQSGPARCRVGLRPEGRAPMRAGVALFASETAQEAIGTVTSGTFAPSIGAPVAMGYVPAARAGPGTRLFGEVRGKRLPVVVAPLPFHPHRFKTSAS